MRKIHLHGALAKHGKVFELEVLTAGEAVVALCSNLPGIMADLRGGSWVVLRGDPETGLCLDEEMVAGMRLGDADLHIMPEVAGAKNGNGLLKTIIGVTLIAASFGSAAFLAAPISSTLLGATTWGNAIGQLGLAMTLSGVSTMLAPEQETAASADNDKSFTLTGPVSAYGQGHAIQIVYGEVITGGMLISGGVDADGLKSIKDKPAETNDPDAVAADEQNWDVGP
ncbi:hypothetical protein PXK56_17985 [Phaeobacter gallaeciensis]|uniref:hypothetical protein n=1 Tax=Phaeobacter gallaeciensis TaxID=60890 RepID=UPI0023806F5F|nr:hypothetical protein [Phaeobacter gallaeciensis]MDE4297080.1 hypothetical protein [Phaeobacter gallaeciensis]